MELIPFNPMQLLAIVLFQLRILFKLLEWGVTEYTISLRVPI